MILPIAAYGMPVLRKVAKDIDSNYPDLKKLIEDMWETLAESHGVGLAAPQVNKDIRLFLVDSALIFDNKDEDDEDGETFPDAPGVKKVFINAKIIDRKGEEWAYNEGCLSIPKIREDIFRPEEITIEYLDENFAPHTDTFNGITARIIQHEYDHIEGKLFIDYLKPLKKKLLQRKLSDISKGNISVDYKMQFPK
ncbi:peptide deformylase [Arachidicoccus ginsenosidimutans]|uniref:peptide deformylase n=1 Tax=Arachidicoccus sp. BS20 TaxID=1850526 RepID=UPI0007F080C2|nr:peptide deformylase [Arachidicoccus sp. BS20]ANI90509.1 peptide deformylase [Arachidicoccus sp. BS20]